MNNIVINVREHIPLQQGKGYGYQMLPNILFTMFVVNKKIFSSFFCCANQLRTNPVHLHRQSENTSVAKKIGMEFAAQ